jgi:hypothetical protein
MNPLLYQYSISMLFDAVVSIVRIKHVHVHMCIFSMFIFLHERQSIFESGPLLKKFPMSVSLNKFKVHVLLQLLNKP